MITHVDCIVPYKAKSEIRTLIIILCFILFFLSHFQYNSGVKSDLGPRTRKPSQSPTRRSNNSLQPSRKSLPRNMPADTYGKPYQYGVAKRGYHSLGGGVMRANRAAKKAAALLPPTSPGSYGVAISIKGIKGKIDCSNFTNIIGFMLDLADR